MPRYTDQDLVRLQAHLDSGHPANTFAPAPRKKRRNEESEMQRALVRWFDLQAKSLFGVNPLLLFSIPNGGARSAVAGAFMKAEGQRRGAPDLMLAVPSLRAIGPTMSQRVHGLFLELKTPEGRVKPEQEVFHQLLGERGYQVEIVRSFEQGVEIITEYLKSQCNPPNQNLSR
jgi:hypothetical protein